VHRQHYDAKAFVSCSNMALSRAPFDLHKAHSNALWEENERRV
jgi:hypothetical protein